MASLAEIRAKLKEQESKSTGQGGGDNAIYPFWNIQEGTTAVLRFLPDADTNNTFFWRERLMIKLPFDGGVKGKTDSKPVQVQIPCMEMYGESCPVLSEVRAWFKSPEMESMGRKYWKKRSYLFQGFVVEDPMNEESKPENLIRRFILGPQIFTLVKDALMDPDMEEMPTDYTSGLDFRLKKTSKGGYADYSTSSWARRTRPLGDAEMQAVNNNGLFNLNDFLPKKPTEVELKIMQEMFEASVDGEAYDEEKWGSYFRPAGLAAKTGDPQSTPAPAPAPKVEAKVEKVEDDDLPFEPDEPKAAAPKETDAAKGGADANDILAMIRNRQKSED